MTWLSFGNLGSACVKAVRKHVGEIDPFLPQKKAGLFWSKWFFLLKRSSFLDTSCHLSVLKIDTRTVANFFNMVALCIVTPGSRVSIMLRTWRRYRSKIFKSLKRVSGTTWLFVIAFFFNPKIKKWFGWMSKQSSEIRDLSEQLRTQILRRLLQVV